MARLLALSCGRPATTPARSASEGCNLVPRLRFGLVWVVLGSVGLLLGPQPVRSADSPRWGGRDDSNMVSDEKGLPESFVPGKKRSDGSGIDLATTENVKWVARLGSQTYGTPTVAGGRVFVGCNDEAMQDPKFRPTRGGAVKCFDEATGKLLWELAIPRKEIHDPSFNFDDMGLGVCSSPTVDGDRVYLVTNRCEVLCLDVHGQANGNDGPFRDEGQYMAGKGKPPIPLGPTDGDIIWRYDMIEQSHVWPQDASNCSVLVHGNLVYVCTSNGVDRSHIRVPRPLAPSLIVLDKRTGRVVAQDDEKNGTRLFHGLWCSPSLAKVNGRELIFWGGGEGVCYAFEPVTATSEMPVPLKKVWSFDCNPPEYRFLDGKPRDYRAGDIRKHRDNKGDGSYVGPSEIIATPVCWHNRVYVTIGQDPSHGRGRGMLTCIDATQTGDVTKTAKIWSYDKIDRSISTVSIAGGLLYVADCCAGDVHCLDPNTGRLFWVHHTGGEIWSSTYVADGKVYVGTKKSLQVLAAGREDKLLSEIRPGSPIMCTPVAANGVLYVASQKYLWAVQAGKKP
jgi:outer membrane protein assembly factor BamB